MKRRKKYFGMFKASLKRGCKCKYCLEKMK